MDMVLPSALLAHAKHTPLSAMAVTNADLSALLNCLPDLGQRWVKSPLAGLASQGCTQSLTTCGDSTRQMTDLVALALLGNSA